ncbi:MAG: hypothetical protein EI684_05925 [Candidatus Viridilinea halotolerans]|uniref:Glycosyltransferase RgtA/B/C/D-like domain-containing protein n=1 Tax=Candidatus Viridilinea halotolerans TaxID=2491704 RepID=A0A426U4S8_9CHLR|nr:MAG: hypothetical protein EI684_05925 [Candidatus Viridilinea halotolerans]
MKQTHILPAALRNEWAALRHPALWLALALLLLVSLMAPQLPLRYAIDVGLSEGYGRDRPYLRDFNDPDFSEHYGGSFRWTTRESHVLLPGVGRRNLIVQLAMLSSSPSVMAMGPATFTLWVHEHFLVEVPVQMEARRVTFLVPPALLEDGSLHLRLRSAIFVPPDDPRLLGVPLGGVTLYAPAALGATPSWSAVGSWLLAALCAWLALRHAFGIGLEAVGKGRQCHSMLRGARWSAGFSRLKPALHRVATDFSDRLLGHPAAIALFILVGLTLLAALINPPRWAFGGQAALVACALAYPLAIVVRWTLPRLMRRVGVPLAAPTLAWLTFIVVVSFALRYGGRLYPESMPGDIDFHYNRFTETLAGLIYLRSLNRGVPFPYPPGPYLLVAPFSLLGLQLPTILQLGAALVDACSAVVIYLIAVRALGQRVALFASGIYLFTAATFMTTWWSFSTHIFTQFLHLLLLAGALTAFHAWQGEDATQRRRWTLGVAVLLCLVFLGHFGFLLNTTLLGLVLACAVWVASWRGAAWARRVRGPLSLAGLAAGSFVALFFYSAYAPLFLEQFSAAREGGLTAVSNREPVSRMAIWNTMWRAGFITHYGLFPLLLMPFGLYLLGRRGRSETGLGPQRALFLFMASSLVAALCFALFPFVSGVSNSPRWLMSIAWVVAVGAALAVAELWQHGRWARLAVVAMASLSLANTAWLWIGPMLWHIRPPEPF